MAYSEGKSSTAYIGFFEGKPESSLPAEVAIDLERALGAKEEHLRRMPKTEHNLSMEDAIHQARDKLREVLGLMLLPPLERKNSKLSDVEKNQAVISPRSLSSS
jgi:hypothetical protein